MRNSKMFNTRTMGEIAIFAALGFVLDFIQGVITEPLFPAGGSIGIALVCVFIVGFRRGCLPAVLTGLLIGLLDLLDGFYAISDAWYKVFAQVALDYWLAYPLAGFAGAFWKKIQVSKGKSSYFWIILACFVGSFAKFLAHFLSGVIFWPKEGQSAFLYSVLYNGGYMLPCFILSTIVMILISKRTQFLIPEDIKTLKEANA